jgi:hypothetical protein
MPWLVEVNVYERRGSRGDVAVEIESVAETQRQRCDDGFDVWCFVNALLPTLPKGSV